MTVQNQQGQLDKSLDVLQLQEQYQDLFLVTVIFGRIDRNFGVTGVNPKVRDNPQKSGYLAGMQWCSSYQESTVFSVMLLSVI